MNILGDLNKRCLFCVPHVILIWSRGCQGFHTRFLVWEGIYMWVDEPLQCETQKQIIKKDTFILV